VMESDDDEEESDLPSDEAKMKSDVLGDELRTCNTVRTEDEIHM
jgi:hypothetical protein